MPKELTRYQHTRKLHHIAFSCYHHQALLSSAEACDLVVETLERVRRWYGFYLNAYVVMPDHVHLLMSEPERGELSVVIQMLKQIVSRKLHHCEKADPFWQRRYYDFNVWSDRKFAEKCGTFTTTRSAAGWCSGRRIGSGVALHTSSMVRRVQSRSNRSGRRASGSGWDWNRSSSCAGNRCPTLRASASRMIWNGY